MTDRTRPGVRAVSLGYGFVLAGLLALPRPTLAGGGPENVALVVNADSWASLAVANEFIHLRNIPASNVIYLENLPNFEHVAVDAFRSTLLKPALETLEKRGLAAQIDYLVYSSDLPHSIDLSGDVGNHKLPKVITPVGSINGLTYLYGGVLAGDLRYLGLQVNAYMRRPLHDVATTERTPEEEEQLQAARRYLQTGRWSDAARIYETLLESHPDDADLLYRLAGMRARRGRKSDAFSFLERAIEAGWSNTRNARADPHLAGLRGESRFNTLLEEMSRVEFDVQPTRGFRSSYGWNARGEIVAEGGQRYLLSTMLAVTSGRGNSVSEALEQLRRSVAADGSRPRGAVYYMQRRDKNVRTEARRPGFASAVAKLRSLSVRAEVQERTLPQGRHDVMGLMTGATYLHWQYSSNTMLPGALCENLTSYGGYLRPGRDQTPLSHFLRYGAAGSSGTVAEPYAIPQKFPHPFLHVHYARGASLAEAFYQSVHGPYQLLIVGDPLCRPWARIPEVKVGIGQAGSEDEGRFVLKPGVAEQEDVKIARYEFFLDGRRAAAILPGETFDIDTTGFPDGYHEARVVAVTDDALETQGHAVSGFLVDNRGHKITAEPTATTIAWDQPLFVNVELPGARRIALLQNRRELASREGERARFEIDPRRLGLGPVRLQAEGEIDETTVLSPPVEVRVVASDPLPPVSPEPAPLRDGLLLRADGAAPVVVRKTLGSQWLSQAGVQAGQAFELRSTFTAAKEDVYQFQLFTDGTVTDLQVDGRPLENPATKQWAFRPVVLAAGTHQLQLRATAGPNRRLTLRFGGPGSMPVGAPRFKHVAAR